MNTLEHRLRDAYQAAAETVRPESVLAGGVPGVDSHVHPTGRPLRRGRLRGRLLVPLAAAAAVFAVIVGAEYLGPHLLTGRQADRGGQPTSAIYLFNGDGNKGTLTPISPVTGRLGEPVTVGPGARSSPGGAFPGTRPSIWQNMVTPDGKADYVAYTGKDGAQFLRRVSLVMGAAGRPIRLRADAQQIMAAPDGKTGYLVSYSRLSGRVKASSLPSWARVSVVVRPITLVTGAVGKPVLRGYGDATIAFTPDGKTAYVAFGYPGTVTPVTTATNIPGQPIRVPGAIQIVMTGYGATADVVGHDSARNLTVTPVATATGRPGKTITVGPWPDRQLVFTPDGKVVYDIYGGASVTPVSIATGRAGRAIKMNGVGNAAITPDGKTLYVVNMIYPRVTPISTATNTPGKPIRMPGFPLYLAASPDGGTMYAYDAGYGTYATKKIVTPISTATNTTGTSIIVKARGIAIVVAGSQSSP